MDNNAEMLDLEEEVSVGVLSVSMVCKNVTTWNVGFYLLVGRPEVFSLSLLRFIWDNSNTLKLGHNNTPLP